FAGGAQQLSWALDTFNLGRFGRTLPPDPRFQQFMRNVIDDLERPAPPAALVVRRERRGLMVAAQGLPDARVLGFELFRHQGTGIFALSDPGVVKISAHDTCMQRRLHRGAYRFAAVADDAWGMSNPTY